MSSVCTAHANSLHFDMRPSWAYETPTAILLFPAAAPMTVDAIVRVHGAWVMPRAWILDLIPSRGSARETRLISQ